jgi:hypothetical protein
MKLSRRGMLALAGAGAAVAGTGAALAQTPAQPPAPSNPDPLDKARQENRHAAETLTNFKIPMSTEPAFVFRP